MVKESKQYRKLENTKHKSPILPLLLFYSPVSRGNS